MNDLTAIPNQETKQTGELPNQEPALVQTDTAVVPASAAYYLLTEDCTVTVSAASGTEQNTAEFPVELHAGDTVCIGADGIFVNGSKPVPEALKDGTGSEITLQITDEETERILKNGSTVDEAFYRKAVQSNQSNPADVDAAAQPGETEASEQENAASPADGNAAEDTAAAAEVETVAVTDRVKTADPNAEKAKESYSLKQLLNDALDLIESVITSVFVVMLLFTFVFCVATVDGDSMVPTLTSGDRLVVNRFDHSFDQGDILILDSQSALLQDSVSGDFYTADGLGKRIVKRLIGQAGDVVNIDFAQGIVYVNGNALSEPYTNTLTTRDNGAFTYPLTVPEGYVFVLGDNRNISKDSRHPQVGLVPVDDIIGRVVLRLTPFSEFGFVS